MVERKRGLFGVSRGLNMKGHLPGEAEQEDGGDKDISVHFYRRFCKAMISLQLTLHFPENDKL